MALSRQLRPLSGKLGVNGDVSLEQLGNWTPFLGLLGDFLELTFVEVRDRCLDLEVHLGDGKASLDWLNSDRGGGFDLLGLETGRTELPGKGHGETAGMGGADQFFRVGAGFVAESFCEGITHVGKHSALR